MFLKLLYISETTQKHSIANCRSAVRRLWLLSSKPTQGSKTFSFKFLGVLWAVCWTEHIQRSKSAGRQRKQKNQVGFSLCPNGTNQELSFIPSRKAMINNFIGDSFFNFVVTGNWCHINVGYCSLASKALLTCLITHCVLCWISDHEFFQCNASQ